jgi:hypothetical protein
LYDVRPSHQSCQFAPVTLKISQKLISGSTVSFLIMEADL